MPEWYGMKQQFEIVIDIQFDSSINKYQHAHADCYLILVAVVERRRERERSRVCA